MSLDVSFTVSGAAVGAASLNLVRCAVRERGSTRSGRATANRLMSWALLLTLALGTVATLGWADDSIQGTQGLDRNPPVLGTAVLCVVGIFVMITANALPGDTSSAPHRVSASDGAATAQASPASSSATGLRRPVKKGTSSRTCSRVSEARRSRIRSTIR